MPDEKYIRIVGCLNGLDGETPELPEDECLNPCMWRINAPEYNNCCWVVSETTEGINDLRKLGKMTGMAHESVRIVIRNALEKLPKNLEELDAACKKIDGEGVRDRVRIDRYMNDIITKLM